MTVVSVGPAFVMDVVKKPLSMGCDELVLLQDDAFGALDAYGTVEVLLAGIRKVGEFDLVLCGRQASDYDQATVPLGLAERLGIPCLTIAQRVEIGDSTIVVDRAVPEGRETFEAPLPALVTVSNELGQPRYPTLRGIMAASRKQPTVWTAADVGLDPGALAPRVETLELFQPAQEKECSFIEGDTDEEKGRLLALRLPRGQADLAPGATVARLPSLDSLLRENDGLGARSAYSRNKALWMTFDIVFLRLLHIIFGSYWVGAAIFFALILEPRTRALASDVRRPVMAAVGRAMGPSLTVSAVISILAGPRPRAAAAVGRPRRPLRVRLGMGHPRRLPRVPGSPRVQWTQRHEHGQAGAP